MTQETKNKLIVASKVGKIGTIAAPFIALASQYSVIEQVAATGGGSVLSSIAKIGIFVVLLANLGNLKKFAENPSAVIIYGLIFGLCYALQDLIDPLLLVSGVGLAGSLSKEGLDKLIGILQPDETAATDDTIQQLITTLKGNADE